MVIIDNHLAPKGLDRMQLDPGTPLSPDSPDTQSSLIGERRGSLPIILSPAILSPNNLSPNPSITLSEVPGPSNGFGMASPMASGTSTPSGLFSPVLPRSTMINTSVSPPQSSIMSPVSPSSPEAPRATVSGLRAKVLYSYRAEEQEEICLIQDEIITNIIKLVEDGWWEGTNSDGERGLFPSNYVQIFKSFSQVKIYLDLCASNIFNVKGS
jgi:hypothetical protein